MVYYILRFELDVMQNDLERFCNRPHSEGMGKVMFSQASLRTHLWGGGEAPPSGQQRGRGYPLPRSWEWVAPPPLAGWGTPPPTQGGMPLAFTQEDSLVLHIF